MEQQPKPVDPERILMCHLTAREWNVALAAFADSVLPHKVMRVVAGKISDQLRAQADGGDPAAEPVPELEPLPVAELPVARRGDRRKPARKREAAHG